MPATSQLRKLISITAISVLSCFRTIRDWFRSFGFCIGASIGHISDDGCNFLAAAPHSISKRTMCGPTRLPYRGRLKWLGELSEDYAPLLHRGIGGGMDTLARRSAVRVLPHQRSTMDLASWFASL